MPGRYSGLWVFVVRRPTERVFVNIVTNEIQFVLIAYDALPVAPLPDGKADTPANRGFETANHRG